MIKLIQQIYGIYLNPHTGFLLVNREIRVICSQKNITKLPKVE